MKKTIIVMPVANEEETMLLIIILRIARNKLSENGKK